MESSFLSIHIRIERIDRKEDSMIATVMQGMDRTHCDHGILFSIYYTYSNRAYRKERGFHDRNAFRPCLASRLKINKQIKKIMLWKIENVSIVSSGVCYVQLF